MQDFKKLKVWEKSHVLTLKVYEVSKTFPKDELFALTSQLRRASSSVAANIAEGCGRKSKKDFSHFLTIAIGSISEVEYFLVLSRDLKYLSSSDFEKINSLANETKRMLISFQKKVDQD